ncbi:hypothetical protein OAG71_00325 [bacterium]|nr:hypothetical protein [bacterium]
MIEIFTNAAFEQWMTSGAHPAAAVQGLDLRKSEQDLTGTDFNGSIFLSCSLSPDGALAITKNGGLVIPNSPSFKFPTHRKELYSVDELFEGYDHSDIHGYHKTYDYTVYLEYKKDGALAIPLNVGLYRRLHDHSITDALYDAIKGRKVVAIMGGHGMERGDAYYTKIAKLSRTLTKDGFLMVSGGGPGAMEATHLGAYFATRSEKDLAAAITILNKRPKDAEPGKEYADPDWLQRAFTVRNKYPLKPAAMKKCMSIGIPTWFYGHEPPAPFATHIAKYFANSIREDGLLAIAKHGVIYAPGSAGTRQEIFQDAAQNHYGTCGFYSPMIFLGQKYWTGKGTEKESFPVWQLLEKTANDNFRDLLMLTDDLNEIVDMVKAYDPELHMSK